MGKSHQPIEDTRRQLIEASIAVISREGIARATTRRISDQAGLPTGTFHYCFDTKEDLLATACESGTLLGLSDIGSEVSPKSGLMNGIAAVVRGYVKWIVRRPDIQKAQIELMIWSWRSDNFQHLAQRNYRRYLDGTVQLLKETRTPEDPDVDLEAVARMMIGILDGAMLQWFSLGDNAFVKATETGIEAIQTYVRANNQEPLREETNGRELQTAAAVDR